MLKYCRINGDVVVEIFPYNPFEWIPNDAFLSTCKECPESTEVGYIYKDGQFIDPSTIPHEPSMDEKIAALTSENTRLKAQLQAQSDRSDFVEDCIAEMATLVYV